MTATTASIGSTLRPSRGLADVRVIPALLAIAVMSGLLCLAVAVSVTSAASRSGIELPAPAPVPQPMTEPAPPPAPQPVTAPPGLDL